MDFIFVNPAFGMSQQPQILESGTCQSRVLPDNDWIDYFFLSTQK
jgi:hypothetical protein